MSEKCRKPQSFFELLSLLLKSYYERAIARKYLSFHLKKKQNEKTLKSLKLIIPFSYRFRISLILLSHQILIPLVDKSYETRPQQDMLISSGFTPYLVLFS